MALKKADHKKRIIPVIFNLSKEEIETYVGFSVDEKEMKTEAIRII